MLLYKCLNIRTFFRSNITPFLPAFCRRPIKVKRYSKFQLLYSKLWKIREQGIKRARVSHSFFIWPRGKNREKIRRCVSSGAAYRDPVPFLRFAVGHSAAGEVTRETSTSLGTGGRRDGVGGCARDEVEDGIGIANISLLRLSPISPVSPIYLSSPPSTVRPLAPERARDTYRRVCFKESSLDDKSSDFAGFKFVTVLNCDASISLVSYRFLSSSKRIYFKTD